MISKKKLVLITVTALLIGVTNTGTSKAEPKRLERPEVRAQNAPIKSDSAQAGKNAGTGEKVKQARDNAVCQRLVERAGKIDQQLTARVSNLQNRVKNRERNMLTRRENGEDRLGQFRIQRNERREAYYTKLEERAETPEQKAAVEEFKTQMEAAVKVRYDAIDKAIAAFQKAKDNALITKAKNADAAGTAYQTAVKTALQEAQSACDEGKDPAEIRTTLQTALKAGKEKLQTDRQGYEGLKNTYAALVQTRNQEVKKAMDDFKAATDKAIAELKVAFPPAGASGNSVK